MPPPTTPSSGAATVILLADDSGDVRAMYKVAMELANFHVVEAADGLEAIQLTHAHRPDAIVMDLAMPRLDGWEACRKLKADPLTRRIPILAVSAQGQDDAEVGALQAGCDGFLAKPCTPDALESCLRRLLGNRQPPNA